MRLEIESLAGGGRGVARLDGRVYFVAGSLPGEVVECEIERRRAGVIEARVLTVLSPSPWREGKPCPIGQSCGGCDLGHVHVDAVAEVLRAIVTGALRHAPAELGIAASTAPVVVSPLHWRQRARLHWDAGSGRLGFLGPRSHRVNGIEPCRVVSHRLLSALPELTRTLSRCVRGNGELVWLESLSGDAVVCGWRGAGSPPPVPVAGIAGWHRLDRSGNAIAGGWGADCVVMELPVPLRVPVGAFFQGNRHLVPRLFARVCELVRSCAPARVVDLYGGVGYLAGAARAAGVDDITVVEASRVSAAAATDNLPGATVFAGEAESFLRAGRLGADALVIVDPPRSGLSQAARAALLAQAPQSILMLSCDAACFGRDAAALLGAGFNLEQLEIWDLFAGSHHAEIVALFQRAER